jgi:hypothetical protein
MQKQERKQEQWNMYARRISPENLFTSSYSADTKLINGGGEL